MQLPDMFAAGAWAATASTWAMWSGMLLQLRTRVHYQLVHRSWCILDILLDCRHCIQWPERDLTPVCPLLGSQTMSYTKVCYINTASYCPLHRWQPMGNPRMTWPSSSLNHQTKTLSLSRLSTDVTLGCMLTQMTDGRWKPHVTKTSGTGSSSQGSPLRTPR